MVANSDRTSVVVNADIYTCAGVMYDRALVCRDGIIEAVKPYDEITYRDGLIDLGGVNLMAAPLDLRILHATDSWRDPQRVVLTWRRDEVFVRALLLERPLAMYSAAHDGTRLRSVHCKMMNQSDSSDLDVTLVWCGPGEACEALARVQEVPSGYVVLTGVDRMHVDEIVAVKTAVRRGHCLLGARADSTADFVCEIGGAMRNLVQRCAIPMDEVVAMASEHIADAFGLATGGRVAVGALARFGVFTNQCALREESVA